MTDVKMYFIRDISIMLGRSIRHTLCSMDTIFTVTITPIAMMLMFVYVFGGAIRTGTNNYVNYLLPGILLIAIASSTAYTAYRLFMDMQRGIFERFRSMPIHRSAALWGHVLTSLVSNVISLAVIAGLSAKSVDGAGAFSYPLIFLPLISSAFVPTETMPPVVRAFAEKQPATSIVNTVRGLRPGPEPEVIFGSLLRGVSLF